MNFSEAMGLLEMRETVGLTKVDMAAFTGAIMGIAKYCPIEIIKEEAEVYGCRHIRDITYVCLAWTAALGVIYIKEFSNQIDAYVGYDAKEHQSLYDEWNKEAVEKSYYFCEELTIGKLMEKYSSKKDFQPFVDFLSHEAIPYIQDRIAIQRITKILWTSMMTQIEYTDLWDTFMKVSKGDRGYFTNLPYVRIQGVDIE